MRQLPEILVLIRSYLYEILDQPPAHLPRKLSTSSLQPSLASPREAALPSPRNRIGTGFDGVLSDTWSSRRRASEALSKPGGGLVNRFERGANDLHTESNGIQEETEEQQRDHNHKLSDSEQKESTKEHSVKSNGQTVQPENGVPSGSYVAVGDLKDKVSYLTLEERPAEGQNNSKGDSPAIGPPPGFTDLASIEWSYLDPQGQTQGESQLRHRSNCLTNIILGPFRADVMQRWHDGGYFSVDLLMKRTHLDLEWTTIGELISRAGNNPVFLTPLFASSTPPGLSRRPDQILDPPVERVQHSPYQPVPTRSMRSSTFDSFMQNESGMPESPTSSFGAGRFANGSPDPGLLDGRVVNQHLFNSGYQASSDPMTNVIGRRATYNEPFDPTFARGPPSHLNNGRMAPGEGVTYTSKHFGFSKAHYSYRE